MKEFIILILIISLFNLAVAIVIHNKTAAKALLKLLLKVFDPIYDLFMCIHFYFTNKCFKKNKSGRKFLPKNKSDL